MFGQEDLRNDGGKNTFEEVRLAMGFPPEMFLGERTIEEDAIGELGLGDGWVEHVMRKKSKRAKGEE